MYDRLRHWDHFNEQMRRHIMQYTLEQYGNSEGNEQVESFTVEDCWREIQRYYNRRRATVRGTKEQLRDLLKVAHYAQFIYDKIRSTSDDPDVYEEPERPQRPYEPGLD
jgi:hypothetical protein